MNLGLKILLSLKLAVYLLSCPLMAMNDKEDPKTSIKRKQFYPKPLTANPRPLEAPKPLEQNYAAPPSPVQAAAGVDHQKERKKKLKKYEKAGALQHNCVIL